MITEKEYLEAKNIVDTYEQQLVLHNVPNRNISMTDMNGVKIIPGHKILYLEGSPYAVTCEVVEKSNGIYLTNWSDGDETILVEDFWYEPSDHIITKVLNPDYGQSKNDR